MSRKPSRDRTPPPGNGAPKPNRLAAPAVCALLVAAVALIYGQTLRHEFVYDDIQYVTDNPHVRSGLTADGFAWAMTSMYASNWHPLTWLSHALDCRLYGMNPRGHRLTNLMLHAANAVLLFLVFWRMTGDFWPCAFAAAVFAVHPQHVESVAWVAERKDLLSGLFFMLTLAAYVRDAGRPFSRLRYAAVVLPFALGLLSKPMLVTLPFVLLLLDYWPLRRFEPSLKSFPGRLLVEKIPLFILSAASCAITILAQEASMSSLGQIRMPLRIANALVAYVDYIVQFVYPAGLAVFYPHPQADWPAWRVTTAAALLSAASLGAIWLFLKRKTPYLTVGWFWYLGMLVPVIGLVQVGLQARADRYMYLPQIGLTIALAWGMKAAAASRRPGDWLHAVLPALAATAVLAWAVCAARQASFWRDSETLWRRALDCTTNNSAAHGNLGVALSAQGRVGEAVEQYRAALAINPRNIESLICLGDALLKLGRLEEAVAPLEEAIRIDPRNWMARNNLGVVYMKQRKNAEAAAEFENALRLNPNDALARNNLGDLLFQKGDVSGALAQWDELIRLQPDHLFALGRSAWLLATSPENSIRNGSRAVELAERAVQLDGGRQPIVLDALAAAYAEAGRFAEAVQTAQRAMARASDPSTRTPAELQKAIQARLELYRAGKSYREQPARLGL